MVKNLTQEIGKLQAEVFYAWTDKAFETGDFTARPFVDLTPSENLALGAIIDLNEEGLSEAVQTGLDVILDTLTQSINKKATRHA